jgi:exodeoxyribonuclease VII large subunit
MARVPSNTPDLLSGNDPEWSVSELSGALKRTLEDRFGHVRVRGELGAVKVHSSGHVYLDIKDDKSSLAAVIWKGNFGRMRIRPEMGMEVVATGKITTYAGSSKYQLIIETLEPAGVGALLAQLEIRRKKLSAEGLFDEARKQLLPFLPETIGVITSPTGAVIRDIIHRLEDRFPRRVIVWPVRVQGETCAAEVAAAINGFNALPDDGPVPKPDLLIVARGGGSLEDLWGFNDEAVVRAAADSFIPLIAAVGHETDWTLIDYAADKRAPTPTGAAEMAVPVRAELLSRVDDNGRRLRTGLRRFVDSLKTEFRSAARAFPAADDLLADPRRRLDLATTRLPAGLARNAQRHRARLTENARRLQKFSPEARLAAFAARLDGLGRRLAAARDANLRAEKRALVERGKRLADLDVRRRTAFVTRLNRLNDRLGALGQLLTSYSYHGVLERGFALVRDETGAPVRSAKTLAAGAAISIEFADGTITARRDR